jgi:hypothetical protein
MGNGQIGGNGSVEWTFVHHNALTGAPEVLHHRIPKKGGNNTRDNGVELIEDDRKVRGRDPIGFPDIGGRPGLVPGSFVVTLTFGSFDEAEQAKGNITQEGSSLVIIVPAVDRSDKNGQNQSRPKEIRIDW